MSDETRFPLLWQVVRPPTRPALQWGVVAGVAACLFVGASATPGALSALTSLPVPFGPFGIDLWLHFVGYAALGGVSAAVLAREGFDRGPARSFGGVAAYGLTMEALHAMLPYRNFSTLDVAANLFGAFAGCAIVWALFHAVSRYRRDPRRYRR